ncbi:MAG: oligosaccharide flippase family protein [Bacteroidales bacterium]|nr:oligosaccharide flippase family protein [Bacteroidales bacterium]
MRKQLIEFLKDSLWYSIKPLLTKGLNFLIIPIYTAYLTPAEYGDLQYILAFGALFRNMVRMGMGSAYWKFKSTNSGYDKGEVTKAFVLTQLFSSSSVLLISFFIKFIFFNNSLIALFVVIYFLAETIHIIFEDTQIIQRANRRPKGYVTGVIAHSVILFLLNAFFIAVLKKDYTWVIYGHLLTFIIVSVIFGRLLTHEMSGRYNIPLVREMLKYGIPLMLGNIASFVITLSDRFFLKEMAGSEKLGLYSYGYKFGDLVYSLLITTFFLSWNPIRWDIYEMKNGKEIFSKFNKILFISLPILGLLIISVALILAQILTVDKDFLKGLNIIFLIGFSHVLYGLFYFNSMGMLFTNKTGKVSQIIIISGVLNIILNFALIPTIGIFGAAIATFLSYFAMFILGSYYGNKYYPIERSRFFEISQIVMSVLVMAILTYYTFYAKNIWQLVLISLITSILMLLVNLALGNIKKQEINQVKSLLLNARKKKKRNRNQENNIPKDEGSL